MPKPFSNLKPEEVVVSCVFDDKPRYQAEALLLYASLDSFGGALAKAKRRAFAVGRLDPELASEFSSLNVEIVRSNPVIDDFPLANKIRMFERSDAGEKVLLALDTDVVFLADALPWLQTDCIAAKPVDHNPLSDSDWKKIYGVFGMEVPAVRFVTHIQRLLTPPYFNSGVISFPTAHLDGFASRWTNMVLTSLEQVASLGESVERFKYFAEQWSFALALVEKGVPYMTLPLQMNYPSHRPIAQTFERNEPILIHHHHEMDEFGLRLSNQAVANMRISALNTELRSFYRRLVWPTWNQTSTEEKASGVS